MKQYKYHCKQQDRGRRFNDRISQVSAHVISKPLHTQHLIHFSIIIFDQDPLHLLWQLQLFDGPSLSIPAGSFSDIQHTVQKPIQADCIRHPLTDGLIDRRIVFKPLCHVWQGHPHCYKADHQGQR